MVAVLAFQTWSLTNGHIPPTVSSLPKQRIMSPLCGAFCCMLCPALFLLFCILHRTHRHKLVYKLLPSKSSPARPFLSGMCHHVQHLVWMLQLCISLGSSRACFGLVRGLLSLASWQFLSLLVWLLSCSSLYSDWDQSLAGAQLKCKL